MDLRPPAYLRAAFQLFLISIVLLAPLKMSAQSPAGSSATQVDLAKLDQRVTAAQSAGDNAWMLVSAALVLMMTGPGLALFYGGLVRKKNVLATMMQSFILMALVSVIWAFYGYSLAFSRGNPFIGGFGYAFLRGIDNAPNTEYAATVPQQTFMLF